MIELYTNAELIAAVKLHGNHSMTYVVANRLRSLCKTDIDAAHVRRRLLKLEKFGRVGRAKTSYVRQICWTVPDEVVL